jgi:hypothetical protein
MFSVAYFGVSASKGFGVSASKGFGVSASSFAASRLGGFVAWFSPSVPSCRSLPWKGASVPS